jgi:hypothetical protein
MEKSQNQFGLCIYRIGNTFDHACRALNKGEAK